MNFFSVLVLLISVIFVSGAVSWDRRGIPYQDYRYSSQVVDNVVTDNIFGGPTYLGWAQVPHILSPMYSPVFGG